MSSKNIKKLEKMYDRVLQEEALAKALKKLRHPHLMSTRLRPRTRGPSRSMSGKIFSKFTKDSKLEEMRENLAKAKETRRRLKERESEEDDDDDDDYKSYSSSSDSDSSAKSKDFKAVQSEEDSDEELLKAYESTVEPEVIVEDQRPLDNYLGIDGFPAINDFPGLLPKELPPYPEGFIQELENNDVCYREVFQQSPNHNMGEILTPILSDYEEPPIDMEELFDVALIETDEQIYEENYLRHSMTQAAFEDKNIDELKDLLESVKRQPL